MLDMLYLVDIANSQGREIVMKFGHVDLYASSLLKAPSDYVLPYFWESHDEVVGVSVLGRLLNLGLCDAVPPKHDVLLDGGSKQHGLLAHHADLLT